MAASPSPRPVRPRPSVVVPATETGAPPTAADSTRLGLVAPRADARPVAHDLDGEVAHHPAVAGQDGGRRGQQRDAGGPRPLGARGAEVLPRDRPAPRPTAARRTRHGRRRRRRSDPPARPPRPATAGPRPTAHDPARTGARRHPYRPADRARRAQATTPAALRRARTASASSRSIGRVTLNASSCPGTTSTVPPRRSTSPASSVATSAPEAAATRCAATMTSRRNPCGVWMERSHSRGERLLHPAGVVDPLRGVGHRQPRHHRIGAGPDGGHHRGHELRRHERPGGVVHEHDVDIVGERRQRQRPPTPAGSPRRRRRAGRRSERGRPAAP